MAEPQAAPRYLYDIASIHDRNPHLPAILGNIDLNRRIQTGDNLDPQDIVHAQKVAKGLQATYEYGLDPRVTEVEARHGDARANAVLAAHSNCHYGPADIIQAMQNMMNAGLNQINGRLDAIDNRLNNRLDTIDNRLDVIDNRLDVIDNRLDVIDNRLDEIDNRLGEMVATTSNTRIIARNHGLLLPFRCQPLYKTVPGHGADLARDLYGGIGNIQHLLVPPANPPRVGTMPPNFNDNYAQYTRADIVTLIVFYNETFGITPNLTVAQCVDKFKAYIASYSF